MSKNPINTTIIPPITDTSPVFKIEEFEDGFMATASYPASAIEALARRAQDELDEEVFRRIAELRGYVKPVRCRDCDHFDGVAMCKRDMYTRTEHDPSGDLHPREVIEGLTFVDAEGYCAWPKPRETCQITDEETASFADAETLAVPAHELKTSTFELGA